MLVSPKWQTMWLESQHCSKSIMNVPLPSQQAKKVLEDLRTNCCSPNKVVQLEALKCWGMWINSQNSDDWKLNTVCFTAVRPLITKKMQPLHKDVDICKLKLSLMWALLVKVEHIIQLEGPQYILEVFLQSCFSWLSSTSGDGCENEASLLIFQLLLSILKRSETPSNFDKEMFTPLTTDILHMKKVFHRLADKFLNIFLHWRKVQDKSMFLKVWKHFLEHCELSCEHIPIPFWHKVFKLADQICSEKNESVKERLAFLHSCATTLKSTLSSSKFIDFGNLLTTPCEALLKKLIELCTVKCTEACDPEMFFHSKEICQMLSEKSVAIGGFELCLRVLDDLEEFWFKELLWGVWCGLVYCYKVHLKHLDRNHFTEVEMKFYRKLRGVAVNFELDRDTLHQDCTSEVEKHIYLLNINCFCSSPFKSKTKPKAEALEPMELDARNPPLPHSPPVGIAERIVRVAPPRGNFSAVAVYKTTKLVPRMTDNFKIDLVKHILKSIDASCTKSLLNYLFGFRFIKEAQPIVRIPFPQSFRLKVDNSQESNLILSCLRAGPPARALSPVPERPTVSKNAVVLYEGRQKPNIPREEGDWKEEREEQEKEKPEEKRKHEERESQEEEVISTPKTRSRKRAEEEMKREMENQKRKKRRSFEVLVQEIVRKNKERKTEKNSRRKSPVVTKGKRNKKTEKPVKEGRVVSNHEKSEVCDRKLRNPKKEEARNEKKKEKKSFKSDGKLENYFKVITKKSGNEIKKDEKKPGKGQKKKGGKRENTCCNTEKEEREKKGEIGWRQTSLKTMMNRKTKGEKNKRSKAADATEEKPKAKKGSKVTESPLSKLSLFKEVFHDHEYAKIEPQQLETFERVLLVKQEKLFEADVLKKVETPDVENASSLEGQVTMKRGLESIESDTELSRTEMKTSETHKLDLQAEGKSEGGEVQAVEQELGQVKASEVPAVHSEKPSTEMDCSEIESSLLQTEGASMPEASKAKGRDSELAEEKLARVESMSEVVDLEDSSQVPADFIPNRKGRKRVRMLDSLKPSKKMRLEEDPQEEKLPLEVTEKENLDDKQPKISSPTKKEKSGASSSVVKSDGSPKTGAGMISSRALRMIALVPESTKGSQIQWESTPKAEVLKCKKAPNVDKNSRASKMLALLSENVAEVEEVEEASGEEVSGRKGLTSTPNLKTPVSSLKSPKSIKKRRSIRFDDAKNETVLYQTDTPPSQILEEKEKCRRFKTADF